MAESTVEWVTVEETDEYERLRKADQTMGSTIFYKGCKFCDDRKKAGETFFPSHHASSGCESGKRNHCTCDACF